MWCTQRAIRSFFKLKLRSKLNQVDRCSKKLYKIGSKLRHFVFRSFLPFALSARSRASSSLSTSSGWASTSRCPPSRHNRVMLLNQFWQLGIAVDAALGGQFVVRELCLSLAVLDSDKLETDCKQTIWYHLAVKSNLTLSRILWPKMFSVKFVRKKNVRSIAHSFSSNILLVIFFVETCFNRFLGKNFFIWTPWTCDVAPEVLSLPERHTRCNFPRCWPSPLLHPQRVEQQHHTCYRRDAISVRKRDPTP